MAPGYPKQIIRATVGARRTRLALEGAKEFATYRDAAAVEKMQLEKWNLAWLRASRLPFYKEWISLHSLPSRLNSLEELNNWPILTKATLRDWAHLVEATPNQVGTYRTSGSTGQPFDFPKGPHEFDSTYAASWSYRIPSGLKPFDAFLLTSNTISGAGISRSAQLKNRILRAAKDTVGNSWKINGFIPRAEDADAALRTISLARPKYLIGYPSAISSIARQAAERGYDYPFLTHAILTSETIEDDDVSDVRDYLKVKVLVEYGAIETGVIAGTPPSSDEWPLKVLTSNALLYAHTSGVTTVSTLAPRLFPLFNYDLGDEILPYSNGPSNSILSIQKVEGRTRDTVRVATKSGGVATVSARELASLIRDRPGILSAQIAQQSIDEIDILIVSPGLDQSDCLQSIRKSFNRNRPEFDSGAIGVRFLAHHIPGARGKRGVVVPSGKIPVGTERFTLSQ